MTGDKIALRALLEDLASAAMGKRGTVVGDLCIELGITRATLYRHVSPSGALRDDGKKIVGR